MAFTDEVKIYIKAGDGGNGCVSFRREKFIPRGGPDGGNGGKGGDVIIQADINTSNLLTYRYKRHFSSQKGTHGSGKNRQGKSGEDLILKVPCGTQIYADNKETLIADLDKSGKTIIMAKGGRGGVGNAYFKSPTNRAPKNATEGELGENMWVYLNLKMISDVGIIGLPNAGKSTLLSVVSAAKPKIGNYPFTTLDPGLGVVNIVKEGFVIADIPGLIEGASDGIGLGHKFLKHIQRCKILLHLIDASDINSILKSYEIIRAELEKFDKTLSEKQEIIAFNKIDVISDEDLIKLKKLVNKHFKDQECFFISGYTNKGVQQLCLHLSNTINTSSESEA